MCLVTRERASGMKQVNKGTKFQNMYDFHKESRWFNLKRFLDSLEMSIKTCPTGTIEALEQGAQYVQSYQ